MSKNRKIVLIVIGIITFLLAILGASYAFFSSTINTANANILYNVSFNNEYDFSVTLNNTSNTGNTLSVPAEDMYFAGETKVIASYDNVFDLTLVNNSTANTTCTYDYVWVWTSASGYNNYTKSTGATLEFTVSGPFNEVQVPNYNAQSFVVGNGTITATSSNTTTRSETITTKFYNLANIDQSAHKGKKYKGYLTIDNASCQSGSGGVTNSGPTSYWFDSTNCTEDSPCAYGLYAGTTYQTGPETGHNVYIGQDSIKYYACATIQGHEVCLSQPYTKYGLSGHTACNNSSCHFTAEQQMNAKNEILQVFNNAGINIDISSCSSMDSAVGCGLGDISCQVFSKGNVRCYEGNTYENSYVTALGNAWCLAPAGGHF